jgi:hypothetical protein
MLPLRHSTSGQCHAITAECVNGRSGRHYTARNCYFTTISTIPTVSSCNLFCIVFVSYINQITDLIDISATTRIIFYESVNVPISYNLQIGTVSNDMTQGMGVTVTPMVSS